VSIPCASAALNFSDVHAKSGSIVRRGAIRIENIVKCIKYVNRTLIKFGSDLVFSQAC
jgi:hypothetical protein